MATRSKEFWIVGFYLAKFGNTISGKETTPPIELNTLKWKEAFNIFFNKLGKGKTAISFENSLKNCRDTFDGHIGNSTRKGWRDLDKKPLKLTTLANSVLNEYNKRSRKSIWKEINAMLSPFKSKIINTIPTNKKGIKLDLFNQKQLKNPAWIREELLLALDLYFRMDYGQMDGRNPDIIQLSNDLKNLNIHSKIPDKHKFRSVNSVSLKLANLKKLDQNFKGKGLSDGGKLEKEIWKEFHGHRDKLNKEADIVRQHYLKPKFEKILVAAEPQLNYKSELLFQIHKHKETDPLFIKIKNDTVLLNSNSLKCEVCGFDSVSFYGELGKDLMEIHYSKELEKGVRTELSLMEDFTIVCSNCHKALDKNFGLLNAYDLKKIIRKR